jgi:hypothetical protein
MSHFHFFSCRKRLVLKKIPLAWVHQFLKSAAMSLSNFSSRVAEEKATVAFRVVLPDGQDEHKSLEIFTAQPSVHCEMSAWNAPELANVA